MIYAFGYRPFVVIGNGKTPRIPTTSVTDVTLYDHDDINRLTDLDWLQNSTTFNARDFTYNRASQVESVSTSNHNLVYQGNHNLTGTWQANGLNQISNIAGQAYTWDGNANLESDGATDYTYDRENRLISTTGAKNITLTYDPLGRLHTTTVDGVTTTFLYSGDALVAEYQGNTLTKVYVHGPGMDDPLIEYTTGAMNDTSRRYLHKDHQGSIVGMSDSGGNVTAFNTYDAFGIPHQSNQGRFSYTGQIYLPELEMYHYKARVYHPKLGRFLQTDPIGYDDQMNLYAYVGNDPMSMVDPSGMEMKCVTDEDGNETCTTTADENNRIWIYVGAGALIAGDVLLGGPTGEGIGPAMAMIGIKQVAKTGAKEAIKHGIKLTRGGLRKIGNLKHLKDDKIADAIRKRGGGQSQIRQLESGLENKTVGEIANMAASGNKAAETALKIVKQASSKAQKYGGK